MKNLKIYVVALLCFAILMPSCSNTSKSTQGGAIGAGSGAVIGGIVGNLIGKNTKSTALGAAIGAAAGTTTGALIGKKMDKQARELAQIEGAQVANVQDSRGLQAIKVTFDSGILFATGKSELSQAARTNLQTFAFSLINNPETYVIVNGHTDNTGSRATNERLSAERARAVGYYLKSKGVSPHRITEQGFAYDEPVADNNDAYGRAQNRRVEVFIVANENMINQATQGVLR